MEIRRAHLGERVERSGGRERSLENTNVDVLMFCRSLMSKSSQLDGVSQRCVPGEEECRPSIENEKSKSNR